ncbi:MULTISPECIES: PepSY-associated TM helix domain-containing protein [Gordonia]|uniref:PepSY domain-containing protein n=1 Tax=Gordonia terrae TaxID=2055 RepID=A0AAD0NZV6_9ACTN|nr:MULTISPECIES: PepSY domain-containing protein [Gordonia]AWO86678.1 PepSY domain-containing protein [Gordonia terrae]MCG7632127.1 PepSY domain-containing protein [Gordonia sp. McavH-238-E]
MRGQHVSLPNLSRSDNPPENPPGTPPDGDPRARRSPPATWQPLLRRLHFYAGIFIAPFLVVAAITGGLYAIAPTLEQVVYRDQLHTESTGDARPVSEQVDAAVRLRPDLTLSAVRPSTEPGDTTRVLFDDPALGASKRLAVFIDPVTLESTGELVSYGSSASLPLRTWLSELHRNLHLGEPGRIYSELAASWLWVIALGGLALWLTAFRARRQRRLAELVTVDRSATGRNRTRNRHGVIGVWIAVGLVFLSATGLTWSKYAGENVSELRTALSWTTPGVETALSEAPSAPAGHGDHDGGHGDHGAHEGQVPDLPSSSGESVAQLDRVLDTARVAGVDGRVEVTIPATADTAFTVAQTRQPWQFGQDSIAVNGATGGVVDISRFADWPLAAKLTTWGIALHMGILFGWVSQLALLVLAVALVMLIVRGYQMWWQRRPRRSGALAVGRPPARGALRRVPVPAAVAVGVVAAAVGWFVPLLGLSLLAFLAVDVALGLRERRGRSASST